jgi:hypothetical protein
MYVIVGNETPSKRFKDNHYSVAATFGSAPPTKLDDDTVARFSALFEAVNNIF